MIGSGYLNASYAPVKFVPAQSGFPTRTTPMARRGFNPVGSVVLARFKLRVSSPYSQDMEDFDGFYKEGKAMMFNPKVDGAFRFTTAEAQRYGTTGFGNACLTAYKVLAANSGTRYIQINYGGGWDNHQKTILTECSNPIREPVRQWPVATDDGPQVERPAQ